jgi:hypothetical protein
LLLFLFLLLLRSSLSTDAAAAALPCVESGPFFCAQQALTPLFNAPSMAQDNLAGLMGFFFSSLLSSLVFVFFAVLVAEGAPGLPRCHYED